MRLRKANGDSRLQFDQLEASYQQKLQKAEEAVRRLRSDNDALNAEVILAVTIL